MAPADQTHTRGPHADPPLRRPAAGSEPVRGTRAALTRVHPPTPVRGTTKSFPGSPPGSSTGGRPGGSNLWAASTPAATPAATHRAAQWLLGLLALLYLLNYWGVLPLGVVVSGV